MSEATIQPTLALEHTAMSEVEALKYLAGYRITRGGRTMDPKAQIVGELDNIWQRGWRGKIYFVDDNIMGSRPYLKKELLPAIIEWKRNKRGVSFHTQITMNLADDQELIDLLYEAGFDWVFIGIETPNEESLAECKKKQNLHRFTQGLKGRKCAREQCIFSFSPTCTRQFQTHHFNDTYQALSRGERIMASPNGIAIG